MSFYPSGDPAAKPLVKRLSEQFPGRVLEASDHRGDLAVTVPRESIVETMTFLRDDDASRLNLLVDVCGADWMGREPRFDVVYHLYSVAKRHRIRIKAGVPEEDPTIDTVTSVFKAADWFERECYDMFGILFRGHPFLRRILTHDDFQGHPLRKDYDQHRRWRCTKVSDLDTVVAVPPAAGTEGV